MTFPEVNKTRVKYGKFIKFKRDLSRMYRKQLTTYDTSNNTPIILFIDLQLM